MFPRFCVLGLFAIFVSLTTRAEFPGIDALPSFVFAPREFSATVPVIVTPDASVEAVSSNTNFVPNESIIITGTGTTRVLEFQRLPDTFGSSVITVSVLIGQNTATSTFNASAPLFSLITNLPPRFGAVSAIAAADFNGDGWCDIVEVPAFGTVVNPGFGSLFFNSGSNSFGQVAFEGNGKQELLVGDFDNNNLPNFAQISRVDSLMTLLEYVGERRFKTNIQTAVDPISILQGVSGDFNHDGRTDFLFLSTNKIAGKAVSLVTFAENIGYGGFDRRTLLQIGGASYIAVADLNHDGQLDFVVDGRSFRGNVDGSFAEYNSELPSGAQLSFFDYDNDGYPDVVASFYNGAAIIYHNDGAGVFEPLFNVAGALQLKSYPPPVGTWGDLNNDGFPDLLYLGAVFLNQGGTNFISAGPQGIVSGLTLFADFDHDGRLDLAVLSGGNVNVNAGAVSVYHNNTIKSNIPPTVPRALNATVLTHSRVILSWGPSSDVETINAFGLRYNLAVGTTANGFDIVSPAADLATGASRIPGAANVGSMTNWVLRDLAPGLYYWRVQAIDPGFASSQFSEESSFEIIEPNRPPAADSFLASLNENEPAAIELHGRDSDGDDLEYIILDEPDHGRISSEGSAVTYLPDKDYIGSDSFEYAVWDGIADSAAAKVTLIVAYAGSPVLRISAGSSGFELVIDADRSDQYTLQTSTNLVDWSDQEVITIDSDGEARRTLNVSDATRFFRFKH